MAGGGVSRALRQFSWSKGKSAGRNSLGRITIWHRGGGAKRLQRTVDLKRNTPSMGVVERIEYDPNRSCRIALVRWTVGADQKEHKAVEEFTRTEKTVQSITPAAVLGPFVFSSLTGNGDHNKLTRFSPAVKRNTVMVGGPTKTPFSKSHFASGSGKISSAKDVFFNAFSTKVVKGENSFDGSTGFPRIAVAGAKPPFFVFRQKEKLGAENAFSLGEIKKWKQDSSLWEDRLKRKAAVSWSSFGRQERLGLVGASTHKEFKPKSGTSKDNRAPCSYIIASNQLEVGKMVMNCEWSKPSSSKK